MRSTSFTFLILLLLAPFVGAQEEKKPFYFPDGIERQSGLSSRWEAFLRYNRATDLCRGNGTFSMGDYSKALRVPKTYDGHTIQFIIDFIVPTADPNKFYSYDFCGQREISKQDVDRAVEDFLHYFEGGVALDFDFWKEIESRAVKERARTVKDVSENDLRARLDSPTPEDPKITYRELMQLPHKMTRGDFTNLREVHLGYNVALGVAWLNTGVLWVSPQARIFDWINGKPLVMAHELVHVNTNLESYPLSERVDVELIASIPMFLFDELDFTFHGYMSRVREWAEVFFGYDVDLVKKEVVLFDYAGNMKFDTEKFDKYLGQQREILGEFMKTFPEKILPGYYQDQIFGTALNDKLNDDRGIFDVLMALTYNPTHLGGSIPTMTWLEAHKPEIRRFAMEAWAESGKPLKDNEDSRAMSQQRIWLLEQLTGMNRDELLKLAKRYKLSVDDLSGKSLPEVLGLFDNLMKREAKRQGGEVTQ